MPVPLSQFSIVCVTWRVREWWHRKHYRGLCQLSGLNSYCPLGYGYREREGGREGKNLLSSLSQAQLDDLSQPTQCAGAARSCCGPPGMGSWPHALLTELSSQLLSAAEGLIAIYGSH